MGYSNQLEAALEKAIKMEPFKTDSHRPPRFRLSSSPFCPYRFIYKWYDFVKSGEADFWDYSADFYTSIGTAIHSNLQKWLPINNPGQYLGYWECPKCKKRIGPAVGPKFCKDCGRWMRYEEFEFHEKPGMSGHCDGIYLLNNSLVKTLNISIDNTKPMDKYLRTCKKPVEAVVLEFKSAGSYKAKKITSPTPNNKAQAMLYVPCANRRLQELGLNINVIGAVVKYISRDNPNSASNDFFLKVETDTLFKYTKNIVKSIYLAVKNNDLSPVQEITSPCKSKFKDLYSDCGYMESCDNLKKDIGDMFSDVRLDIKKDFKYLKAIRGK